VFQGPDILRQMGFQFNGTSQVGLLGAVVTVDNWVVAIPDGPTHKDQARGLGRCHGFCGVYVEWVW
jgi:hypothetical protein